MEEGCSKGDGNTSPRFGRIEKADRICHFANGVMPYCLCVTKDARNKVNKIMLQSLMMAVLTLDLDAPKSKKISRPQAHHRSNRQPDVAKAHHP